MPLDPQNQAMLDGLAAAKVPSIHELPPVQCREMFRQLMSTLPPSTKTVAKVEDRAGGDLPVGLRIFTPQGTGPFPLTLYFHGGGWVIGDLDSHHNTCQELCAGSGSIVVAVDYRLAPEHRFPAAVDDAWAALKWLAAHAGELGGDPARIAVAGDSAGGNLAAVTAMRARLDLPGVVKAQLLVYPVTKHYEDGSPSMAAFAEGYFLGRQDMVWFTDHYLGPTGDHVHPHFNISRAPLAANLAPAFVITAEYDPLRDEGEAFAQALQAAGVPARLTRYPGAIHGFFSFFGVLDVGRAAMDDASAWLREQLRAA